MTQIAFLQKLKAFGRDEDGNITVEFVILFPLLMLILVMTIELGLILVRGMMLERALDLTVRELRLTTGITRQHDEIRDAICSRATFVNDCDTEMRVEMIRVDPFDFPAINHIPDCIDNAESVSPVRTFQNGQSNELMFIRACMKFDPLFPTLALGEALSKDESGRIKLFTASAFVQEPR
ncbi:TadE/TadG family type IV pilus assembly protein [Epibacterium ulvae]|uniref:TadE/TadG family type IV pilus assembly protein n=1 Tax=Epibacterium ulvae TaxID=1156985 RepID=UPI0024914449|nr:TadE/TadG family type IV pilus assembly protein [Epibacterium ulvae]